jgi:hypothetical protein
MMNKPVILMMRFDSTVTVLLNRVCSASYDSEAFFQTSPDPGVKLIPLSSEMVRSASFYEKFSRNETLCLL